ATIESGATLNINNAVLLKNKFTSAQLNAALICHNDRGNVNVNGMVLKENEFYTTASGTLAKQMFATRAASDTTGKCVLNNVYCDDTEVTRDLQGVSGLTAKIGDSYMTSGEAAYALNASATSDNIFWYTTTEDGVELGTKANATRKVELKLSDGEIVDTYYVNVGSTQELDYADFEGESFEYEGDEAVIKGNALTLNMNMDIVVTVKLHGGELVIEAANVKTSEEIKVTIKVNTGTYGISNLAFDLSYDPSLTLKSDKKLNYFDTVTVTDDENGKITITATNVDNIVGEAGIAELIFEPTNAEATLQFDATIAAYTLDAMGAEKYVEMDCAGKTVYSNDQPLKGDVDQSGSVELPDVVLVLRVLAGTLNVEHIDVEAANIYVDDGFTDNYGINTLDAIKILEMAM
ncbi:MAG: hypothetical protein IJN80_08230, partial [Clostridia bacterium]|nr:hypothetical protein [Clostridia bacterium]